MLNAWRLCATFLTSHDEHPSIDAARGWCVVKAPCPSSRPFLWRCRQRRVNCDGSGVLRVYCVSALSAVSSLHQSFIRMRSQLGQAAGRNAPHGPGLTFHFCRLPPLALPCVDLTLWSQGVANMQGCRPPWVSSSHLDVWVFSLALCGCICWALTLRLPSLGQAARKGLGRRCGPLCFCSAPLESPVPHFAAAALCRRPAGVLRWCGCGVRPFVACVCPADLFNRPSLAAVIYSAQGSSGGSSRRARVLF